MNKRILLLSALGVAILAALIYPLLARREGDVSASSGNAPVPVVETVTASTHPMQRTLHVSGALKSGSEASLSPKQGGRIAAVLAHEGDRVRLGQVLVRLDASDSQQQARQASAGVAAARANWEKAITGEKLKRADIERRIADARRGVDQAHTQLAKAEAGIALQNRTGQADIQRAQAGVDAAHATLLQAKRGARPEQRRQAEIQLRQAQRGETQARKNLDDIEFLFQKGGVPRVQLDEAREGYQKAQDGVAQAQAQLDLLKAGASAEEVAAAEAQVRSAEAALTAAKAGADRGGLDRADVAAAKSQVKQAEDGLKSAIESRSELDVSRRDVDAAHAAYEQALAGSRLAYQQVGATTITSPMDGLITAVNGNPGEMAGPGQPLITVVGTAGVYLDAAASARDVQLLRSGQSATVAVDAIGGRTFPGAVRTIAGTAGPDGRSFPVRIDLTAPAGLLKPGGMARADVVTESFPDATTVPPDAVRNDGNRNRVQVVRQGVLASVPVDVVLQDSARAMVRGDIHPGDQVIIAGDSGLKPGARVRSEPARSH